MMKFETILNAYGNACMWVGYYGLKKRWEDDPYLTKNNRQRDAFRARLIAVYQTERDNAELYHRLAETGVTPDEYWRSETMGVEE